MANARNPKKKGYDTNRDGGGFIALPWSVIDCPAYACLSHPAKVLLLEVARQFVKNNNGRLLITRAYLGKRGWKSSDTITNAKRQLLDGGFIYETVMGHRPNKASWYAVTWLGLDKLHGYDAGALEGFKRSAYLQNFPLINTNLRPSVGTEKALIAPPVSTASLTTVPSDGAVNAISGGRSVPPYGHHLEMPSLQLSQKSRLEFK
jgi:hypothetical protein